MFRTAGALISYNNYPANPPFRGRSRLSVFYQTECGTERHEVWNKARLSDLKNEKDNRLKEIVDNKKKYQREYVEAAQRIMEERKEVR